MSPVETEPEGGAGSPRTFVHDHQPIYRVVRRGWSDPLDSSFSRRRDDRRWNTPDFPALYCCCSEVVARDVTRDLLLEAAVEPEDLQPDLRPQLVEIGWRGEVVDVVTEEGVAEAGFPMDYPAGVVLADTQEAAKVWHQKAAEGVCCRSASVHRRGRASWSEEHEVFGEVAIYPDNAEEAPRLLSRRGDLDWLRITGTAGDTP